MAKRRTPEQDFQASLVEAFETILLPGTEFFAVPNGGARSKVEAKILKGQGVRAGVPDLIVIHEGRAHGLELKAGKRGLSEAQRGLHPLLARAGMQICVIRTIDEALGALDLWRVPTRIKPKDEWKSARAYSS